MTFSKVSVIYNAHILTLTLKIIWINVMLQIGILQEMTNNAMSYWQFMSSFKMSLDGFNASEVQAIGGALSETDASKYENRVRCLLHVFIVFICRYSFNVSFVWSKLAAHILVKDFSILLINSNLAFSFHLDCEAVQAMNCCCCFAQLKKMFFYLL